MNASTIAIVAIIPTYNNAATIIGVIESVKAHVDQVIVVNDGSTDGTTAALDRYMENKPAGVRVFKFDTNRGKGAALREGLLKANALGFTHAITLDADGQHDGADLPKFIKKITEDPLALWIGCRDIAAKESAKPPLRSTLGRKWGAFWYKFETGISISDTQSGFRAYPIAAILDLGIRAGRFEFEMAVLIKAAWNGIAVKALPITLRYLPRSETVSHFRPVRDFLRLFGVNSSAALTRIFLPYKTMNLPGKTARQKIIYLFKRELTANLTPRHGAFSLALGVFFGIAPLYGLQVVSLLGLSFFIKINRPLAFLGVNISPAPLMPLYAYLGILTGRMLLPHNLIASIAPRYSSTILQGGVEWFVGSIVLATAAGVVTFLVGYGVLIGWRKWR